MVTPKHIAFIMDGNGRWATQRGLKRSAGHKAGYEHIPKVLEVCRDLGVQIVSGYAWSTENWGRPSPEVKYIMRAIEKHLSRFVSELHKQGVRFVHSGRHAELSPRAVRILEEAVALTQNNGPWVFNLAFNYGGRDEILQATRSLLLENNGLELFTEESFKQKLYMPNLPDVDLVIRTGGDVRMSNFLLWQTAYACLFVADNYWPAITGADIEEGIVYYNRVLVPA